MSDRPATAPEGAERLRVCATPDQIDDLAPHPRLDMFRRPEKQHRALIAIARDPQACVSVADHQGVLVAYAAFHPPSDIESWGEDRTGRIRELGAVEVAPPYRGRRLAERLLRASFAEGRFDDTVVIATMYVWHYDLRRTGLSDFGYRRLLERLYGSVGLEPFATADAEVRSNAANLLMARIGPHADASVVEEFHRLRTRPRFEFG